MPHPFIKIIPSTSGVTGVYCVHKVIIRTLIEIYGIAYLKWLPLRDHEVNSYQQSA